MSGFPSAFPRSNSAGGNWENESTADKQASGNDGDALLGSHSEKQYRHPSGQMISPGFLTGPRMSAQSVARGNVSYGRGKYLHKPAELPRRSTVNISPPQQPLKPGAVTYSPTQSFTSQISSPSTFTVDHWVPGTVVPEAPKPEQVIHDTPQSKTENSQATGWDADEASNKQDYQRQISAPAERRLSNQGFELTQRRSSTGNVQHSPTNESSGPLEHSTEPQSIKSGIKTICSDLHDDDHTDQKYLQAVKDITATYVLNSHGLSNILNLLVDICLEERNWVVRVCRLLQAFVNVNVEGSKAREVLMQRLHKEYKGRYQMKSSNVTHYENYVIALFTLTDLLRDNRRAPFRPLLMASTECFIDLLSSGNESFIEIASSHLNNMKDVLYEHRSMLVQHSEEEQSPKLYRSLHVSTRRGILHPHTSLRARRLFLHVLDLHLTRQAGTQHLPEDVALLYKEDQH